MNSIFIKKKCIKLSYFFENNKFEIKLNYNFNYKIIFYFPKNIQQIVKMK